MGAASRDLWYFAYGSNLDPDRFRDRVGPWSEHRRAVLDGYRLRFSGEVTSEGGGGAVIVEAPGHRVHGGAYRIGADQMERMDAVELGSEVDPDHVGRRCTVALACPEGAVEAEIYLVPESRLYRAPSASYLGHILRGLRWFGHPEEVVDEVRRRALAEGG